jgi:hypothetical protein
LFIREYIFPWCKNIVSEFKNLISKGIHFKIHFKKNKSFQTKLEFLYFVFVYVYCSCSERQLYVNMIRACFKGLSARKFSVSYLKYSKLLIHMCISYQAKKLKLLFISYLISNMEMCWFCAFCVQKNQFLFCLFSRFKILTSKKTWSERKK